MSKSIFKKTAGIASTPLGQLAFKAKRKEKMQKQNTYNLLCALVHGLKNLFKGRRALVLVCNVKAGPARTKPVLWGLGLFPGSSPGTPWS